MNEIYYPGPGPSILAPRSYPGRPIAAPQEGEISTGPIPTQATDLAAPSWTGKTLVAGDPTPDHPAAITGVPFAATAAGEGQTRTVDLGFTGYSLPDGTADTYDGRTGELVQRVGKVVLDGTEAWEFGSAGVQANTVNIALYIGPVGGASAVSTHFALSLEGVDAARFYVWGNLQGIDLFIPKTLLSAPTVEAAKEWLAAQKAAGTPVTVLYELPEPIVTTRKADLPCFEGETEITGADRVEIMDGRVDRVGGYLPGELVRSNPNMLVNGRLLINQRGQERYNGSYTRGLDCWLSNNITITPIPGGGVKATTPATLDDCKMYQVVPLYDGCTTLSMRVDGQICTLTGTVMARKDYGGHTLYIGVIRLGDTDYGYSQITFLRPNTTYIIDGAKLELGTESTLWVDLLQPPDYAAQLRECQRYLLDVTMGTHYISSGYLTENSTLYYFPLHFPVEMASAPTLITTPKFKARLSTGGYSAYTGMKLVAADNAAITDFGGRFACLRLGLKTAVDTPNNQPVVAELNNVILSCEL